MSKREEPLSDLLEKSPKNWGKWGSNDEIGGLNYLNSEEIMRGIKSVNYGKSFTLMLELCSPKGEPVFPGRLPAIHYMSKDKGSYEAGKLKAAPGGLEYAEDNILINCHGTTHCDALAHTWYDDIAWNGFEAAGSKGGLEKASILPIAEKGIVGHVVLLDVARYKNKPYLNKNENINLEDLLETAKSQNIQIQKRDIIIIRTGTMKFFYENGPEEFYNDFNEPGLSYEPELIEWLSEMEIPVLGSDTLRGEQFSSATVEAVFPMHAALSRNLGIAFTEAHWLEGWKMTLRKTKNMMAYTWYLP